MLYYKRLLELNSVKSLPQRGSKTLSEFKNQHI